MISHSRILKTKVLPNFFFVNQNIDNKTWSWSVLRFIGFKLRTNDSIDQFVIPADAQSQSKTLNDGERNTGSPEDRGGAGHAALLRADHAPGPHIRRPPVIPHHRPGTTTRGKLNRNTPGYQQNVVDKYDLDLFKSLF